MAESGGDVRASRTRRGASRRRCTAGILLLATSTIAVSARADADLTNLMREFAAIPGFSAHFREEKRITVLEMPLVSEGMLYFAPPDRLARLTERPVKSTLILSGRTLTIREGDTQRSLDSETAPAIGALVDSVRLLLAGDLEALQQIHDLALYGDIGSRWILRMAPRHEPLKELVRQIEVSGIGRDIVRLRVSEPGGDESSSVFSEIDSSRHFDAAEQKRLFGVSDP